MIVRTYGRRNRSISRNCSDSGYNEDVSESFRDSLSQESPQDIYSFAFSSQDSSHWDFDSEPFGSNSLQESRQLAILPPRKEVIGGDLEDGGGGFRKSKKARNRKRELEVPHKLKSRAARSISVVPTVTATATLMETQEFGEMMEHVDEVNFALDGLRKGQPARIRRASLLSLLSICGTAQQRRLLRTQGMAKTIIDAVLGLSFDDSPSNLAAAALFYILTSDGQDDHLLDSPSCIRFLIKLLKPLASDATKDKGSTIGGKLLALRKDVDILQDTARGLDSTASAILLKVQEILVSCKEMKSSDGNDNGKGKPELSPKWIALLTMEKACLSTISIEDTSGTVRKTGGNFKEKLRELGGLDAVFEVARNCHTIMEEILVTCFFPDDISFLNYTILVIVKFTEEGWLEKSSSSILESKDNANLESLVLLLKCLKIMENATFLSKDNQNHLLEMKGNFNSQGSPRSFTKLIISAIKILSGLSLLKSSSDNSHKDEFYNLSNGTCHAPDISLIVDHKESAVDSNEILSVSSSIRCCNTELTASQKSFNVSQNSQLLPAGRSGFSKSHSESATPSAADTCLLKMRVNSSASGSCSGTSRSSNREMSASNNGSRMSLGLGTRPKVTEDTKFEFLEDSEDPFAFDEDDFELSKWDLLSGKQKESRTRKSIATYREPEDGCQFQPMLSQQESSNGENHCSHEAACSSAVDKEKSNRLAECLLTAVKVLMNLTNDNAVGCQQIAACGGLETLSLLIADHFPLFSSSMPPFSEISENSLSSSVEVDHQNDRHLTDQELDFLVAILGLLVNLVEKDNHNRSRLASARVPFPGFKGLQEEHCRDVIPLLCSIFLANQGAGEVAGEGKLETWDDEAAVLQGEREAEKMIVEAYAALLLAFLSTESRKIRNAIAEYLPDHKLATLVPVLERFVEFHLALNMISPETHSTVLEVIESCRVP